MQDTFGTIFAAGFTIGLLLVIGNTPLYPLAYGMLAAAGLYVVMHHSSVLSSTVDTIYGKLGA